MGILTSETLLQLLQTFIDSPKQVKQIHTLVLLGGHLLSGDKSPGNAFSGSEWKITCIYNTLMRSYLKMGASQAVLTLFNHMLSHQVTPNDLTFPSLIKAASFLPPFASTCSAALHVQALKRGVLADPFVQTSFLRYYAEVGDLRSALKVFDEIPHPCIVVYNAMLDAFGRNGDTGSAFWLFENMPEKDVVSWTSVINGLARNARYSEGISVFAKMVVHEHALTGTMKPNEATFVSVLSCCAYLDRGGCCIGKQIHGYIIRRNIFLSAFLGTSLVDLYGKAGWLEMAIRAFNLTEPKRVCTWNAIISSMACNGREKEALDMFEEMQVQNLHPNEITFVAVLTACARSRLVELGLRLFNSMSTQYGVEPILEHYGCMVDLWGRAGLLVEAIEFVKGMPLEPDDSVLGALLGACKIHGSTEPGIEIGKGLFDCQPLNCGQYIALSSMNFLKRNWSHAANIRRSMVEAGLKKPPAYSLIIRS